ncbi:MAG: glycosyltransferase family 4 protein [Ignavibacteria bacterium]
MIPFLIKNRDIDLCFINSSVCFVEMLVVNFFKIPYVLSIKEKINPAWIRNLIYKFVSKTSVKIIVISKFLYDLYSKSENYKIKIIHSSIEEDFYQECYNKTEEEKDRNKKFVILNIAAFYDLKNQLSLVNAVNLINNSDDILVKFIGKNVDNKYFDHLLKEIENSKNRNSFEIVGELDKKSLIKEIKKSHCVVITSKEEGQSLVLLEAMFLERAVISTKVGVVSEIIKNYENGLLYDVNDSQTLSEHILKLKNDKELYTGIIKSSKETYHRNFSLERSLRQHEEIFRNAMQI